MKMKRFSSFTLYPGVTSHLHTSDRFFLAILTVVLLVQIFVILYALNNFFLVESPVQYGTFTEGTTETLRSRNPLYANNTAEEDLSTLLHASLFTYDGNGKLIPELAEDIIEMDTHTFTVKIRDDALFHNDVPITADDVLFTIEMLRKNVAVSRYTHLWDGVNVTKVNEKELLITPDGKSLLFPEALTTPILPSYIWRKLPPDEWVRTRKTNNFIGAGPYKYSYETVDIDENPVEIQLERSDTYVLHSPYIREIRLRFYDTLNNLVNALQEGVVDAISSVSPADVETVRALGEQEQDLHQLTTDRVFGVFFNTTDGKILTDPLLRGILSQRLDREKIVSEILGGYAMPLWRPLARDRTEIDEKLTADEVERTLNDVGWRFDPSTGKRARDGKNLAITFVYPSFEEMEKIVDVIINSWEILGFTVTRVPLTLDGVERRAESGDFDAIFYGYNARTSKDLIPLWRSGDAQNLAALTSFGTPALNTHFDKLSASTQKDDLQDVIYDDIRSEIEKGYPAVFLYSPSFLYFLNREVKNFDTKHINTPSDRFANIHNWYIKRDKVWEGLTGYFRR